MKNVLFYGSGAVNLSLMGWLADPKINFTVLARPASADALREFGVEVECDGLVSIVHPHVITDIADAPDADLVVIGVKAYALDEAIQVIRTRYDRNVPVLSVLNGVRHVDLLRSKFVNVLFATICYNAYRELPYRSVALSRGPLVFTSSRGTEKHIRREVFALMKGKVEVIQHSDPFDVACNKMIINLGNALMSLVGFHENRDRDLKELQHLSAHLFWEGVLVMKANGVKEVDMPGLPSWRLLKWSLLLPQFITVPVFRKKMAFSAINSMAQDVERGTLTEIEEINGQFLTMAKKTTVSVPYNKAVYDLFKEWSASKAASLSPTEVLAKVRSASKR